MKKIFNFALLFAAACTVSVNLTSCSSDDDKPMISITEQNDAIKALSTDYLNDVVYPTYSNLANETENLYQKISALKKKLKAGEAVSDADIAAICDSYKTARKYWEQSEAFLFGAASDFEIDPHIDTWPLDVVTLAKDLQDDNKIKALDAAESNGEARKYLTKENLGFHGIEFIFFRDGKNRSKEIFNNDAVESFEDYFKGMNVTGKEEVIFAAAVACDLRDKCYQLEVAWLGNKAPKAHRERVAECAKKFDDYKVTVAKNGLSYGEDILAASTPTSTHTTWKKVMETIFVSGRSGICAEVADQKMGQAYRSAVGKPEEHKDEDGNIVKDDPNYIESPYSHNSYNDFYDNIMSIQNSLYGNIEAPSGKWDNTSAMGYLVKYNATAAAELNSKLQAALMALNNCRTSGKAFVQNPGDGMVKVAMDAVSELDDCLNETSKWILAN